VRALPILIERLQIKGQFPHVFRFKAAGLQFRRDETL
jgi:hypothetical protein